VPFWCVYAPLCRETHTPMLYFRTQPLYGNLIYTMQRVFMDVQVCCLCGKLCLLCWRLCVCAAAAAAARRRFIFIGFTAHCLHNVKCEHRAANFLSQPNRPHSALGLIKPQFRPSQRTLSERFMFAEAHSRRGQKRARAPFMTDLG
jgi:hypothetical protein